MGILDEVLEQIDGTEGRQQDTPPANQQDPQKQQQPPADEANDSDWYSDEFKRAFRMK